MGGGMGKGGMSKPSPENASGMQGMNGNSAAPGSTGGSAAAPASPPVPGVSHLIHIGATGFYVDQAAQIELSPEQQAALNTARERALLEQSTAERQIAQSEQDLWTLTAADQPDPAAVEAKIREVEKLRGDARIAFLRAVGDASQLLNEEQRRTLGGFPSRAPQRPPSATPAMQDM